MKKRSRKERKEAFKKAYYAELEKQGLKDKPVKKTITRKKKVVESEN